MSDVPTQCEQILKNGRRCMKNAIRETKFCNIHKKEDVPTDNSAVPEEKHVCGICLEEVDIKELFCLNPCSHRFHLSCIELLTKKECPSCRQEPTNLTDEIIQKIQENNSNWMRELQAEDEEAVRALRERYITRIPTPEEEIQLAVETLRQSSIPLRFLPSRMEIEFSNAPGMRPPPGALATVLIKQAFLAFCMSVGKLSEEDFENLSSDDDNDEFSEEDRRIISSETPVHITLQNL